MPKMPARIFGETLEKAIKRLRAHPAAAAAENKPQQQTSVDSVVSGMTALVDRSELTAYLSAGDAHNLDLFTETVRRFAGSHHAFDKGGMLIAINERDDYTNSNPVNRHRQIHLLLAYFKFIPYDIWDMPHHGGAEDALVGEVQKTEGFACIEKPRLAGLVEIKRWEYFITYPNALIFSAAAYGEREPADICLFIHGEFKDDSHLEYMAKQRGIKYCVLAEFGAKNA